MNITFKQALSQREFPVCEDGGESKVLRSRTIPIVINLGPRL